MDTQNRRYVFITFEDLKKVRFKKLEKVCDRIFIFINAQETSVPFLLVQQIQKLGKGAKWVPINGPTGQNINYHLCFLMGKLHQKVHSTIEFAVLSNDEGFDPLIAFINEQGRSCLRVKRKGTKKNRGIQTPAPSSEKPLQIEEGYSESNHSDDQPANMFPENPIDNQIYNHTAKETIRRLIRSGNRPAEVDTLKKYIQLYNQELTEYDGNIERIIGEMQESNDIKIQEGMVTYNF